MITHFIRFSILLAILTISSNAFSHQTGRSVFIADVRPDVVDTLLTLPLRDIASDLELDEQNITSVGREKITAYFNRTLRVSVDGKTCATEKIRLGPTEFGRDMWFLKSYRCPTSRPSRSRPKRTSRPSRSRPKRTSRPSRSRPKRTNSVVFHVEAMANSPGGYLHFAKIERAGVVTSTAFNASETTFSLGDESVEQPASPNGFSRFFTLGFRHVCIGLDHLLFLLGLLFLSRRAKTLLGLVTLFTIAHATTIVLSSLDILTFPAVVIEPLIALTIVGIGVETTRQKVGVGTAGLVLILGLIHGFGFAYAIADVGLPQGRELLSLLGFNLGVEAAQISFILIGFALLFGADRLGVDIDRVRKPLGILIACIGAIWFIARLLE